MATLALNDNLMSELEQYPTHSSYIILVDFEMFGRGKGGKEVAFLNKCKLRWRVLLYRLGRLIDTLAVIKEC